MGTNYYAVRRKPTLEEPIHIGKSSGGWLFCFQEQKINWGKYHCEWHTYNQVKAWLKEHTTGENPPYTILNEYDEELTFDEFIKIVDDKQKDPHCLSNPENFNFTTKNIDGYRFTEGDFS